MTTAHINGYNSASGICWVHRNRGGCTCPVHSVGYGRCALVWFGHCKSGRRWFWMAGGYDVSERAFGWEATEALAISAAITVVRRAKQPGLPMLAYFDPGMASRMLKKLKRTRKRPTRRTRPVPRPNEPRKVKPDLAALWEARKAAHPDKGGSDAAFIEANAAWETARRALRSRSAP